MSNFKEPLILAIDTATRAGSVALARGGEVLILQCGNSEASHSIDLIANVEVSLNSIEAELGDVDLFAAASGPGSFTGLRIGLATIKSFAISIGRLCVGVPTLAAIAHAAGASTRTVALLPAGRGEVFAQLFSVDAENVRPLDSATHIRPEALLDKYGQIESLTWAGEGAHLNVEGLRAGAEARHITFSDGTDTETHVITPPSGTSGSGHSTSREWRLATRCAELAVSIAALALAEYNSGTATSPEELRAIYVRPSDAEINEQWQREKSQRRAPIQES